MFLFKEQKIHLVREIKFMKKFCRCINFCWNDIGFNCSIGMCCYCFEGPENSSDHQKGGAQNALVGPSIQPKALYVFSLCSNNNLTI
jgi:hypothetical protein